MSARNNPIFSLDRDYWRRYYDADTAAQSDALRREYSVTSTGVRLHIDAYEQADPAAPVVIFNHGGGGYCRLFVGLALGLYARGYAVLLPDQRGQGYSDGDRGDFTLGECVQNIIDVTRWARQRYHGALFLGGASVGGGLAYKAAAAGAPVDAVICHNLYDFGRARDALAISRFTALSNFPGVAAVSALLVTLLGTIAPGVKLPFRALGAFEKMIDERDNSFPIWRGDPIPVFWISLRYLKSTFGTPPAIPYEQNNLPILVINQKRDRMVSPAVTRRNFERLRGPVKYVEIDYGHWAMSAQFVQEYVGILDRFLRAYTNRQAPHGAATALDKAEPAP